MLFIILNLIGIMFASNLIEFDDSSDKIISLLTEKNLSFKYSKSSAEDKICIFNDPFFKTETCFSKDEFKCLMIEDNVYAYRCEGTIYKFGTNPGKINYDRNIFDDHFVSYIDFTDGKNSLILVMDANNVSQEAGNQKFIAKINSNDGTLDDSYKVNPCDCQSYIKELKVDPSDDSVYLAGGFHILEDGKCQSLSFAKLNKSGKIDKSFSFLASKGSEVKDFVVLENGDMVLVGEINYQNIKKYIVKINKDGNLLNFNDNRLGTDGIPDEIFLSNDKQTLFIRGGFTRYNNLSADGFVIVDTEGLPLDIGSSVIDSKESLKQKKGDLKKQKEAIADPEIKRAFNVYSKGEIIKEKTFVKEAEIQNIKKELLELEGIANDKNSASKERIKALRNINKLKTVLENKKESLNKFKLNKLNKNENQKENSTWEHVGEGAYRETRKGLKKEYIKYRRKEFKEKLKEFNSDGLIDEAESLEIKKLRKTKKKDIQEEKIYYMETDINRILEVMLGYQSIMNDSSKSVSERNRAEKKYLEKQSEIKAKNDVLKSLQNRHDKLIEKGESKAWFVD